MINEIHIIPPVATYNTSAVLGDLRKINYIFGANGTGKTTISRVIAGEQGHTHCSLSWKGAIPLERLVYNRDFVDRNFNQNSPLQGVFTLGEDENEAEQAIKALKPQADRIISDISSLNGQLDGENGQAGKRKELSDLEVSLREKCWKQKQRHDEYFQDAFSGVRNSAEKFKDRVLAEKASNSVDLLTLDELKEKAQTIFSNSIERISSLDDLVVGDFSTIEGNALLKKVIVGDQDVDIAGLIDRLGNSDWVKQGLHYHKQEPEICPFCQQPTNEGFAKSLQAFFSDEYDNDVQSIKQLQVGYQRASEALLSSVQRAIGLRNPFLKNELFSSIAQILTEKLQINQTKLANKIDEPSRKVELEPIEPLVIQLQGFLAEANEATHSHNQIVTNITNEKRTLTTQVWRYVLNELTDVLNQYDVEKQQLNKTIQGMEKSLQDKKARLRELEDQIKELEEQTTSIQPTVSAINDLLQKFGFTSFSIGATEDGKNYRIIRASGEDASRSLSEGEKTFITFLYFYHLIKGAQSSSGVASNRVVVFDDPISSLDSDILYIVSSLIKGIMDEVRSQNSQIKQIFVLTHNIYFHKEVSFSKSRPADGTFSDESFWLVKKLQTGSTVTRSEVNPIRSAYELLWEEIKSENISSVSLQNTLRRILENYFTMWGGKSKDEICALFDGNDRLICQSLFSWVNDGSHSIHDDLYINHGDQTNEVYLRVFREVFHRSGQIGHYRMMTGYDGETGL